MKQQIEKIAALVLQKLNSQDNFYCYFDTSRSDNSGEIYFDILDIKSKYHYNEPILTFVCVNKGNLPEYTYVAINTTFFNIEKYDGKCALDIGKKYCPNFPILFLGLEPIAIITHVRDNNFEICNGMNKFDADCSEAAKYILKGLYKDELLL